jgi:hypothetical protein
VCEGDAVGGGMVNGGDEGEGIWLMGFIYIYETSYNYFKCGGLGMGGGDGRGDLTNVQCKSIQNYHNESPLYNKYILI